MEATIIGCIVLAFALCQPGGYQYAQQYYGGGYYQQQYYQQPQVVYVPVQQPVYVAQPIYPVAQPYYGGGGYGYNQYPFAGMGGASVRVGPRGGVAISVGR